MKQAVGEGRGARSLRIALAWGFVGLMLALPLGTGCQKAMSNGEGGVLDAIREDAALAGRTFAVIADEAHSSQSGNAAGTLKNILSAAELNDLAGGGAVDVVDLLAAVATATAAPPNATVHGCTPTPPAPTTPLFGPATPYL